MTLKRMSLATPVASRTPVTIAYAATITPDATAGSLFRITATGNLTLNDPTGGTDGREIVVEITASGADRTLSFQGGVPASLTITSGDTWSAVLRYNAGTTTWLLDDNGAGASATKASVGLGNVDNTSDANKPLSTAELAILPPAVASGQYFLATSPGGQTSSTGIGNGSMRVAPWIVYRTMTIDRIGVEVATAGDVGSKVRPVIYADNGSSQPGTLVVDGGQLAGDAVAAPVATISTVLTPGTYWIGAAVQAVTTTSPNLRCIVGGWMAPILLPHGTSYTSGTTLVGYSTTGVTGAAPTPFGTTATTGTCARVFCRVA